MFFPDDIQHLDAASVLVNRWLQHHWLSPVP
jgi:hypothetical protein